jgi:hypothetical protein
LLDLNWAVVEALRAFTLAYIVCCTKMSHLTSTSHGYKSRILCRRMKLCLLRCETDMVCIIHCPLCINSNELPALFYRPQPAGPSNPDLEPSNGPMIRVTKLAQFFQSRTSRKPLTSHT